MARKTSSINSKKLSINKKTVIHSVLPISQQFSTPSIQFIYFIFLYIRLRDGIEKNPENWKNCTMYVQDLIRPGINVTAEVPKKEVDNFQQLCQMFAKQRLCEKLSSYKNIIKVGSNKLN